MSSVHKSSVIGSALSRILEDDLLCAGSVTIVDIYVAIVDTDVFLVSTKGVILNGNVPLTLEPFSNLQGSIP
jgi:hypothetical protein